MNILATGTGGIGGINFIRALTIAEAQQGAKLFLIGIDHNQFFLEFPQLDVRVVSPRHE